MGLQQDLAPLCAVRAAQAHDHVDGVMPQVVARPASTEETAAVLRAAYDGGLTVTVRGNGTKSSWGTPPTRVDVLLETGAMADLVEHAQGDLIATAGAGMSLTAFTQALAAGDQQLLVDDPVGGGTLGGLLAADVSGGRRMIPGALRDLLIGVRMVRADGTVAKAGGKVVKNVAGYDLGKLLIGSYGTLGVITEATFRLHPVPLASRWVHAPVPDAHLGTTLAALVHSQLVPGALEVDRPAGATQTTVAVLLTGTEGGVESRAAALYEMLPDASVGGSPDWTAAHPWVGADAPQVALKLTTRISGVPALVEQGARHGLHLRGSAGVGVLYGALPAAAADAATVEALRGTCTDLGGSLVVLDAPSGTKELLDVWGPVGGLDLMRRVKHEFDPTGVLSPGRFVGGI